MSNVVPSPAQTIDGRKLAAALRARLKNHVDVLLNDHKILPSLAVVLVGDDPASHVYVANKKKAAEKVGIRSTVHQLPRETSQDEVLKLVHKLNDDARTHGSWCNCPYRNKSIPPRFYARLTPPRMLMA